ncbi:MAG: ATP-binding protein [Elusimicrobiales bacterium]|jgi:signal transduction histidine kinase
MEKPPEMRPPLRVLCLEDSPEDAELLRELLLNSGRNITVDHAAVEREFSARLRGCAYDIILTDFKIAGFDGFASLRLAADLCPGVPVICVSGTIGEETAVELLKAGAVDYILKDRIIRLPAAIDRAVAEAKERAAGRQAAKALSQAKQEMENLLYITSHDLRSPLVNIQGFTRNLERDFDELRELLKPIVLPDGIRAAVDKINTESIPVSLGFITKSVRQMDQRISALLKVSRAGRVDLHPEIVDVNAVMKSVLDDLRYQLEALGANVKTGVLPSCRADYGCVNHIFTNLLANALKYRDNSRKLEITVMGENNSDTTALYIVSDNGIGMPVEALGRIWQLFSHIKSSSAQDGEGIGLAMCRIMTDRNGGRIWAESKEGAGSRFFVEMPT